MIRIDSDKNEKIKNLIKIRDFSKYRKEQNLYFLEGLRLIKDIDKDLIKYIFLNENYKGFMPQICDDNIFILNDKVFNNIKETNNSQGIIALAKKNDKKLGFENFKNINAIVFLDDIQDPGNLGTIFRTLEASAIKDICITSNSCDIYSPKVLRSSMSSFFRLNIYEIDDKLDFLKNMKKYGFNLITTEIDGDLEYYNYDFNKKTIMVFGNEANGICEEIKEIKDESIKISMKGEIESLNIATSLAVISFERKRQLENGKK